jgi:outer membrane protein, heavy metal efflux system
VAEKCPPFRSRDPLLRRLLHASCAALALGVSAPAAEPPPRPAEVLPEFPITVSRPAAAAAEVAPAAEVPELSVDVLVEQVLARNPSLAQMVAAWKAAQARYPQVTALEDPMFAATIGPGTIAPDDPGVEFAYRLEISQKVPYPGKRRLRGDNALAEASAAGHDVDDMRLQLVESARDAFYEYYLAERGLEVNERTLDLLERYRKNAATRYERGLVPLQDAVQARVEVGREQDRRLTLEEARRIAVARINTLMHLSPDSPLPPPPRRLSPGDGLPDVAELRAVALAGRPDLKALADRVRAEEASLALACKDFYPDFEPFFMYDRFMGNMPDNRDLASMLGVRMNLPVYREKRYAAVAEAQTRIAQRRAELAKQADQVNFEVQQAYERLQTSERAVRLYEKTVLPAARENVEAAESAYQTGKVPFLSLIEAQRNEVMLLDRYHEAVADSFRRRATLERVVGGPLTASPPPGVPAPTPPGTPLPGPGSVRRPPG